MVKRKKLAENSQLQGLMDTFDNEPEQETAVAETPAPQKDIPQEVLDALRALREEVAELKEEKRKKEKVERKTKRVNLLMRPSTYNKASDVAEAEKLSFNEAVERALLEWAENRLKERG